MDLALSRHKRNDLRTAVVAILSANALVLPLDFPAQAEASKKLPSITVTSTAFGEGQRIPRDYTGDGKDLSPALKWTAPPPNTKSIALSVEDPDAPRGTWWHWILSDIPPQVRELKENASRSSQLPSGAAEGINDFKKAGYNGPLPPKGQSHRYQFNIVALDTVLKLKPGMTKVEYSQAIKGHVVAEGRLTGTYSR